MKSALFTYINYVNESRQPHKFCRMDHCRTIQSLLYITFIATTMHVVIFIIEVVLVELSDICTTSLVNTNPIFHNNSNGDDIRICIQE